MKIYQKKISILRSAVIAAIVFILAQAATAQRLKPTEILYSRLPADLNQPPVGANSPTIWAVGQDGVNDRQITTGMQPRISDDGRFLLFRRLTCTTPNFSYCYNPYAAQPTGQLWVRDLANSSETMILDYTNQSNILLGYYFSPFSNQGNSEIVLDYGSQLYKMNRDGTGLATLPDPNGRFGDRFPVLRRGDSLMAGNSRYVGIVTRILNSGAAADIPNTVYGDYNPSWSNDNQFIGFTSFNPSVGCFGYEPGPRNTGSGCNYPYYFSQISKIKPDGTGRTSLADFAANNSSGFSYGTVWTNDNSKIIVAARINGVAGLYAIKTDGSGAYTQIPISDGTAPDFVGGIVQARPEKPIEPPAPKSAEEIAALLASATFAPAAPSSGRAVRVVNQVVASGGTVTVPINVDTMGDETGYTFSIAFDRTKMTATGVVIGNLGGNVISNINNTNGTIAFSVASFSGANGEIPEATNQTLVKINFTTAGSLTGGVTTVALVDSPTRRKVSGTDPGNPLPQPTYTNGTTTVAGATGAGAGYAGWWAGDGDARDSSGLNNNAALASAPNTPGFAIGKVGQAYNFTAEGQYVSIPDSPAVRPQSFTIEGWAKLTGQQSAAPTVFGKGLGTGYYDSYVVWYDGNLNAAVCDPSAGCFQISAAFTPNVWHHVAFTFSDAGAGTTKTGVLYIDGVAVANGTTGIAAGHDATPALIGADYDGAVIRYSWSGGLDEISLLNRVLTATEIQSIYNAGQRGKIKQAATAAGANSNTQIGDATLTFANVSTAGTTIDYTIDPATAGTLPSNYTNTGLAYDISTTAVYSGAITECFHLPAFADETTFSRLKILHSENGALVDRTTTYNFPARTLCAQTISLSPFVIAGGLAPTAATVTVGGRVAVGDRGLARARVTLTGENGTTRTTQTNPLGYYRFDDVPSGATYVLAAAAKGCLFAPQVVTVNEELLNLNFTPQP